MNDSQGIPTLACQPAKKQYGAPQLRFYGDLRNLTLGSSRSPTESTMKVMAASSPDIYRQ